MARNTAITPTTRTISTSPSPTSASGSRKCLETMMSEPLQSTIEDAWEARDSINPGDTALREAVEAAILRLDRGEERVAEKVDGEWRVNQWLKKAVLLSFRLNPMEAIPGGPGGANWWDKVPSKFLGWSDNAFGAAGFRA